MIKASSLHLPGETESNYEEPQREEREFESWTSAITSKVVYHYVATLRNLLI
jgi:hypothetical protein